MNSHSVAITATTLRRFKYRAVTLAVVSLLLVPNAHASQTSVDLSSLIGRLEKKYSRMAGLSARFRQIHIGADGRLRQESGTLFLKRPGKARWNYESPERKIFVSDGKNIFFFVYGEPEALKASIRESRDPQIPFLFLLGRDNLRREFSRIELATNEEPLTRGAVVIRLFSKRAPEEFKQILVEVDPTILVVSRVVMVQPDNTRMDFHLSGIQEGQAAPDSQFVFTPPPGVRVRRAE